MAGIEWNYVENLVWVKQTANNKTECQDYKYFKKSKVSLLIFKKVKKKEVFQGCLNK